MKQSDTPAVWVKKGRTKARLSQSQLARQLDISTIHISKIERGKAMPSLGLLKQMTRIFGKNFVI